MIHVMNAQGEILVTGANNLTGSGTPGRVAQWTGTHSLGAATLVKEGAGVLVLEADSGYTLRVPATGTAVLGTGVTDRVAVWTSVNDVTGYSSLIYTSSDTRLNVINSATSAAGPGLRLRKERGTGNASSGDLLGGIFAEGRGGAEFRDSASIRFIAAENFGNSSGWGSYISFWATPIGGSAPLERMRLTAAGYLGIGLDAPESRLHVMESGTIPAIITENTASDHNPRTAIRIVRRRADATAPNAGFGASLDVQLEGFSNGSLASVSSIQTIWEVNQTNDTTDRDSALIFSTMLDNALAERVRITSRGDLHVGSVPTSISSSALGGRGIFVARDSSSGGCEVNTIWLSSGTSPAVIRVHVGSGTLGSPGATLANQWAAFGMTGYSAAGVAVLGSRAYIGLHAAENWSASAQGTYITFWTTPTGTITPLERIQISANGTVRPGSAGVQNLGDATYYWNDVSYKTLTDRGCLGWFDDGVTLADGRVVSDTEALLSIHKHPTRLTVYGVPMLDYESLPPVVYKPAPIADQDIYERDGNGKKRLLYRKGEKAGADGAEMTALISIMLGAIRELAMRVRDLEARA